MGRTGIRGPYQHRRRWRIDIRTASGARRTVSFATRGEADAAAAALREDLERHAAETRAAELFAEAEAELGRAEAVGLGRRSIGAGLDAYEVARRSSGKVTGRTVVNERTALDALLGADADVAIARVTTEWARQRYLALASVQAVTTHQRTLGSARQFWSWLVRERWAVCNPWRDVEPVGRPGPGHAQLLSGDVARVAALALARARGHQLPDTPFRAEFRLGALAALVLLYLGPRPGEVVERLLVAGVTPGRLDYIPFKQRNQRSRRLIVRVCDPLDELLLARAEECRAQGELRLFPRSRKWPSLHVKRLCEAAAVEPITAHGLRGTHASLASEAGETMEAIARQLGHRGTAVTRQHYARADNDSARTAKVAAVLGTSTFQPRQHPSGRPAPPVDGESRANRLAIELARVRLAAERLEADLEAELNRVTATGDPVTRSECGDRDPNDFAAVRPQNEDSELL